MNGIGGSLYEKDYDARVSRQYAVLFGIGERGRSGGEGEIRNEFGQTPLHYMAGCRSGRMVAAHLGTGADIEATDNDGHTPLWHAVMMENIPAIEALLKAGADPHANCGERTTILEWAHRESTQAIIQILEGN